MSSSEEAQLGKRSKPDSQRLYDDKTKQKLKTTNEKSDEDEFEGEDEEFDDQEGEEEFIFDEEEEGVFEDGEE